MVISASNHVYVHAQNIKSLSLTEMARTVHTGSTHDYKEHIRDLTDSEIV